MIFSEGDTDANKTSRCWRHSSIFRLSGSDAPGLEQKHDNGSSRGDWLPDSLRGRRGLGIEGVWSLALKRTGQSQKKLTPASENVFAGQSVAPTGKELAAVLGSNLVLWTRLVSDLRQELKLDGEDWHSSGLKYGWSCRLQRKKRNIVYLGPRVGRFVAAFALGDKALAVARQSGLPARVLNMLADAKRYAEGTAVRIEVSSPEDLEIVKALARVKVEN